MNGLVMMSIGYVSRPMRYVCDFKVLVGEWAGQQEGLEKQLGAAGR